MKENLDDGLTWTVIDEVSGHSTWSDGEIKSFTPGVEYAHGPIYKMDVSANAGAGLWCLEELSFYDLFGNLMATQPSMASAETEWSAVYAAGMAFNEVTDDDASYYCSRSVVSHCEVGKSCFALVDWMANDGR